MLKSEYTLKYDGVRVETDLYWTPLCKDGRVGGDVETLSAALTQIEVHSGQRASVGDLIQEHKSRHLLFFTVELHDGP